MQISNSILMNGFRQSYSRTRDAKNTRNGEQVFFALFETLNWIFCIDDKLKKHDPNWFQQFGDEGKLVIALRYARNRVQHQWADITTMTEGFAIPMQIPLAFHEWIWKPVEDIPSPSNRFSDRDGKDLYVELLGRKPVRYSLEKFSIFLDSLNTEE